MMNYQKQTIKYSLQNQLLITIPFTFFYCLVGGTTLLIVRTPKFFTNFAFFTIAVWLYTLVEAFWTVGKVIVTHRYIQNKQIQLSNSDAQETFLVSNLKTLTRFRSSESEIKPSLFFAI